jgi:hypothetical protein
MIHALTDCPLVRAGIDEKALVHAIADWEVWLGCGSPGREVYVCVLYITIYTRIYYIFIYTCYIHVCVRVCACVIHTHTHTHTHTHSSVFLFIYSIKRSFFFVTCQQVLEKRGTKQINKNEREREIYIYIEREREREYRNIEAGWRR